ncbi:MAG: histidinol-phosphate transaminase [Crocinitomicaceae bacterium]|nr:histidinol-phosphate transaminase [Crocinitomicaceae bacterium]
MKEINQLIRPDLLSMQAYSSARDEFSGEASVFLDANENPFNNGVNRYPDPLQKELKQRVSAIKKVNVNQLFLGNGSDECIDLLFRLFCRPGIDTAAAIAPSYGMYGVSARINQINLKQIALEADFSLDVKRILSEAKGSKLLFLCSPNNPTGQSFPKELLLEIVQQFDGLVIVDEAYIDFSAEESMLNDLANFSNLVVIQTFSKAYGMAAIRLGMLFGSQELISWLNKIKPPYNINSLTQNYALDKLMDLNAIEKAIELIKIERELLKDILKDLKIVEFVYPSDANFILIKVKDSVTIYNYLISKGIVVRERSSQLLCSNTLRLSIGTPEENKLLVEALRNYPK